MKCLIDNCERESFRRVLCRSCYQTAWAYVKSGKSTWDQLIEFGFAQAAKNPGPGAGKFMLAVQKKKLALESEEIGDRND